MRLIWNVIAFFKRLSIKQNIELLNDLYVEVCEAEKNIIFYKKNGLKKKLQACEQNIMEYIEFCGVKKVNAKIDVNRIEMHLEDTKDALSSKSILDWQLTKATKEYDRMYSVFSSSGENLLGTRTESICTIDLVTNFINGIAKHPKKFDAEIKEIVVEKNKFKTAYDFGMDQKKLLESSAKFGSVGIAAGTAVAGIAPTAAMWVATTFGTASTGTAISALSGAAAHNAALAWLGGGALASGGAGMAAGQALLALAGPVGWGVAGASIFATAVLFIRKKFKQNEQKKNEIISIKNSTQRIKELTAKMNNLNVQTKELNNRLTLQLNDCKSLLNQNYEMFTSEQKMKLGTIINNTKSLSVLLSTTLEN